MKDSLFNLAASCNIFAYCRLERKQEKEGKKEGNTPVTENKNCDKNILTTMIRNHCMA